MKTDRLSENPWSFDQSIYANSLENASQHLDLMSLSGIESSAPLQVLEMVLDRKTLPVRLTASETQNQLFWHFYGEQRSQERIKGIRALGLGYPIVLAEGENGKLAMPVFIWSLRLEPSLYRANEWELYHSSQDPCKLNPRLLEWVSQQEISDIHSTVPSHPDKETIGAIIQQLATELKLESDHQSLAISPCPSSDELQAVPDENSMLWSGVIGIYPQYLGSASDVEEIYSEDIPEAGYNYGLLPQNPEQASALAMARKQSLSWVEGISGTGKTHLLTQIVSMALVNGQKCLVISPSANNLKEIQNRLAELGLQRLQYLIRNPETETGMLMDFFRAMAEGSYLPPEYDSTKYNLYLDRCERERQKLDERYAAIRQQVFGQNDWTETVGLFLESNQRVGKELLGMQLYTQDFEFSYPEFQALSEAINLSQPLYDKVNTLKHQLSDLHPHLFLKHEKEEGRVFIADRLEVFLAKAIRLQRRYFAKVNQYGESLRKHYDKHYQNLFATVGEIKEKMAEGKNQFSQPFEENSERTLRFYGFFSKKQKEILQARIQIEDLYTELKQKFELFDYFDFTLPPAGNKPVEQLRPFVLAFEETLIKWQHKHFAIIQDNIQRLNRKTIHPRLHLEEDIEELEDNLEHLLLELNETQLYDQKFEHKMLTIPKRQRYLESVIEQLEVTKRNLPDFNNFYDWQRNWLNISPSAQKLVRALIKVKPSDWEAAFKSWYLHHCLNLAHTPQLPQVDDGLNTFVDSFKELQPMLPTVIAQQWDKRRIEAVRKLKSDHKKVYPLLFSRQEEETSNLKHIHEKWRLGLDSISEVLPVLLVGDAVIPYLLQENSKVYDYILIDEAHLLSSSQLTKLQELGRRLVVLSDPSLESIAGANSWPAMWRKQGVPSTRLNNVQEWRPSNLLQQANAKVQETDSTLSYPVIFEQVEGRYDEETQMNSAEAENLIKLLNRIEKTPQRTFPTVGIVCMTKGQRSLINQLIFQIKKQNTAGADTIRQLERNGMGIYTIDELTGLHFQVLIFSGTWGVANTRGDVTRHLKQLDSAESMGKLYLLMGRATQNVYILNSIPNGKLKELSNNDSSSGSFWYANYLLYLQAAAKNNFTTQQQIVQELHAQISTPPTAVFPKQVAQELKLYLRNQELETNYEKANRQFPLVIKGDGEETRSIVVQPDGFFANSPATDYTWEYEQRKQLAKMGYSFLPAWSVKWWRETSLEAKRMAATLMNLLEE